MNITFINKADKDVYITLHGETFTSETLEKSQSKTVTADGISSFAVQVDEGSYVTYILESFGIILKRHFKVKSEYSIDTDSDITVTLSSQKKKGKFMDEYERVIALSQHCSLTSYSIPDETRLKKELESANKHTNNTVKIFDIFDIIGNTFSALLLLFIPFVIIWIVADIQLAGKICGIAFIPIFALIVCLNRFFDKLKRNLWKTARSKRLEKEIFKDYNSYFDNEYIASVLDR